MKFKYKDKISIKNIIVNLVVITGFFYLIFNSYKFKDLSKQTAVQAYSNNFWVLSEEISDWASIDPKNIIISDTSDNWIIYYIVQPGDSLSFIANNFWVTVSHIKKINHLKKDIIKPWQKLVITDEDGFIYISKWETSLQLAKKFNIKEEDILNSNSIWIKNYTFEKWSEVFIPISDKDLKKYYKNYLSANKTVTRYIAPVRNTSTKRYKWKNVIAKYWYNPHISNWFYRWQCTWYVAIKKFPYITKKKQKKLWNGNAKYWYKNAKAAWYKVWKTPKIWSIVVIRVWWRHYYYAWHVAIVRQIDWKNKRLLVEEMNALWKYIVTKRWIHMNSKIVWYIYYRLDK